ncbi:hypothetical protein WJX74_001679 [Apatococcus lobatus]|uniref:Thioredoxin domain-containing protein n=1 Tax=Apatococcus lobatus TaxID=904363 RepID=A0AAW1QWQ9_9CHLO
MQPDMTRMQSNAAEPDPNKRIYGKAMVTKVGALVQQHAELTQQVQEHMEAATAHPATQATTSMPSAPDLQPIGTGAASSGSAAAAADAQLAAETVRKANEVAATAVPPSADPEAAAQPKASLPMQSPSASMASVLEDAGKSSAPGREQVSSEIHEFASHQDHQLPRKAFENPRKSMAPGAHDALQTDSHESSATASNGSATHDSQQHSLNQGHVGSQQPFLAVCSPAYATSIPLQGAQAAGSRMTNTAPSREAAPPAVSPPAAAANSQLSDSTHAASSSADAESTAVGQTAWAGMDLPKISTAASLTADPAAVTSISSPGQPCLGPTSPRFPTAQQAAANSIASFAAEAAPIRQLPNSASPSAASVTTSGTNAAFAAAGPEAAGPVPEVAARAAAPSAGTGAPAASHAAASQDEIEPHLRTARPPIGHVLELRQGRAQFDRLLQEMATSMEADAEDLLVLDFQATWCGPCKMMVPVVEQLAREMVGQAVFVSVDAEATPMNNSFANEMHIRGFPTFYIFARSMPAILPGAARSSFRQLETFSGARPVAALRTSLQTHYDTLMTPSATVNRLHSTLSSLKQATSFGDFLAATKVLLLFVSNVLAHQDDPKYKRVKASNSRYQTAVGSKQGGPTCMLALGFRLQRINNQQVFVMHRQPAGLAEVKRLLEQAMAAASQAVPAASHPAPQSQAFAAAPGPSTPSQRPGSNSNVLPAAMASQLAAMLRSGASGHLAMPAPQQQGQQAEGQSRIPSSNAGTAPDAAALARQLAQMLIPGTMPPAAASQHQTAGRDSPLPESQPGSGPMSTTTQAPGPDLQNLAASPTPQQAGHAQAGTAPSANQPFATAPAAGQVTSSEQQEATEQDAALSEEDLLRMAIKESMRDEGSGQ